MFFKPRKSIILFPSSTWTLDKSTPTTVASGFSIAKGIIFPPNEQPISRTFAFFKSGLIKSNNLKLDFNFSGCVW